MRPLELLGTLRKLAEFLDLSKLPAVLTDLKAVFDGSPPLDAPGGIETRIREFVSLAASIASATKPEGDDKLVAGLQAIASNDALLGLVAAAIRWWIDNAGDGEPERLPAIDAEPFTQAAIDPGTLTTIITLLVELYRLFKAWRGGGV